MNFMHSDESRSRDYSHLLRGLAAAALSVAVDDLQRFASHYAKRDTLAPATFRESFRRAVESDGWLTSHTTEGLRLTLDDCCCMLNVDCDAVREGIYKRIPQEALSAIWNAVDDSPGKPWRQRLRARRAAERRDMAAVQ